MTARTDVTVNYELSPRVVTVAAPSVEVTVQDLHDTLAFNQDTNLGGQHPQLVASEGKKEIDTGKFISITTTMQNAVLEFEARTTAINTYTISTADTGGQVVTAITATFQSDGIERGMLVTNFTDNSHATVVSVDSETQITTTPLTGGSDNQYDVPDMLDIHEVLQCTIKGGNLLAVDDVGADIVPTLPTFGTSITRILSTDATLIDSNALTLGQFIGTKDL